VKHQWAHTDLFPGEEETEREMWRRNVCAHCGLRRIALARSLRCSWYYFADSLLYDQSPTCDEVLMRRVLM
jgi:hypothetical protein